MFRVELCASSLTIAQQKALPSAKLRKNVQLHLQCTQDICAEQFHHAPFTVYDAADADDDDDVFLSTLEEKKTKFKLPFKYVHRHRINI